MQGRHEARHDGARLAPTSTLHSNLSILGLTSKTSLFWAWSGFVKTQYTKGASESYLPCFLIMHSRERHDNKPTNLPNHTSCRPPLSTATYHAKTSSTAQRIELALLVCRCARLGPDKKQYAKTENANKTPKESAGTVQPQIHACVPCTVPRPTFAPTAAGGGQTASGAVRTCCVSTTCSSVGAWLARAGVSTVKSDTPA